MSSNILALDIGEKRIGVAVGTTLAFGRGVIEVTTPEATLVAIGYIVEESSITSIVIGVPEVKSGEVTPIHALARTWAAQIHERYHLPVTLVNEAYSSVEAERQLRAEGVDTAQNKARIDERAAMLLLEQYLATS